MGTRNFHWDPIDDCILMETDQNGNTIVTYTHEPGQFGPLLSENRDSGWNTLTIDDWSALDVDDWASLPVSNPTEYYHHYDALGSTTFLADDTGTVTDTFQYDAWGNIVARSGTTATPYQWVGRWGYQYDTSTAGYYVRSRSYQPAVARWTAVDPLYLISESHAYSPFANSPILLIDPTGRKCNKVCGQSRLYAPGKQISELDQLLDDSTCFTDLAVQGRLNLLLNPVVSRGQVGNFKIPSEFGTTGPKFFTNSAPYDYDDLNKGMVPFSSRSVIVGSYLYYLTFDVCENHDKDCRIRFDEPNSTITYYYPNAPAATVDTSKRQGDVSNFTFVAYCKLKTPYDGCDTKIILVDMPNYYAVMQGGPYRFWYTNKIHQELKIVDRDDKLYKNPLAEMTQDLTIGVGPNREHIAEFNIPAG